MDIVREPSSVNITILANDDYAGVFSFATTSLALSVGMCIMYSLAFTPYSITGCINILSVHKTSKTEHSIHPYKDMHGSLDLLVFLSS